MSRTSRSLLLLAAAAIGVASPAAAHRQWLLPSATSLSGEDPWVSFDAAVSNDLFYVDHFPMQLGGIKVWQPDGTPGEMQHGSTGRYRSVFDVQLTKPGTWKIGTEMSGLQGSFKVDGQERRVGGRPGPGGPGGAGRPEGPGGPQHDRQGAPGGRGGANGGAPRPPAVSASDIPANATDVKLTQTLSRNFVFVTRGEPTATVFQPTNKGLEMVPVTHPDELVAGEAASFRFLVDGKPAPGLKVAVVPGGKRYRDAEDGMELTTGSDGVLKVTFPTAGMYWLNAGFTDNKPTEARATDRRMSYTSTFEVMTP